MCSDCSNLPSSAAALLAPSEDDNLTPEQEDILAELKGKQQEDISFAVAAGQSTAISSNIANRNISEQTKIPLNETRARNERVAKLLKFTLRY
jgi:hypothetical protein